MLRIDWDVQTTPYIDNITYLTIRTGWSRAYRNILSGIAVRDPARGASLRKEIEALLIEISQQGGQALKTPNVPEFVIIKFDQYEVVVTHGVIYTSVTPGGRYVGDFNLVTAMMDEMDDVLTDVFKIERYVQAALL